MKCLKSCTRVVLGSPAFSSNGLKSRMTRWGGTFFVAAGEDISDNYFPYECDPQHINSVKYNYQSEGIVDTWLITAKLDGKVIGMKTITVGL